MRINSLLSPDMRDPDTRMQILQKLLKGAESYCQKYPSTESDALYNYAQSLIEGAASNSIDFSMWKSLAEKMQQLLDAIKIVQAPPQAWTLEMYDEARLQVKSRFRKNKAVYAPIILVFSSPAKVEPFLNNGIEAFYYGPSADYGRMSIVLPREVVAQKVPSNWEVFAPIHSKSFPCMWIAKANKAELLHASINSACYNAYKIGFPWDA